MNLIIYPPKSPIAFSIFDCPIRTYGIILTSAIIVGLFVVFFLIKKQYDFKRADEFIDFSPILIISSIIGARLFYITGCFDFYQKNLKEIIMINHGGISIYGAIIFGIITLYIYLKKKNYNVKKYFDMAAIATSLAQAIGRWGNYFNQEAFGRSTNNFIKLFVDEKYRPPGMEDVSFFHPTFLYESILDFILFLLLILIYNSNKKLKDGTIFYLYLILYGLIRILVEYFRVDSVLYIKNLPIAQVISIIVIVFGLVNLFIIYFKKIKPNKKQKNTLL